MECSFQCSEHERRNEARGGRLVKPSGVYVVSVWRYLRQEGNPELGGISFPK